MRLRTERRGSTLAELLAALTLTLLLGAVLLGLLLAQLALARATARRAVSAEATRTAVHVLTGEVQRARPEDVRALGSDSLALRSFRGMGIICAVVPGSVLVRYRGDRLPDARKDSVLLLPSNHAAALLDSRTTTADCPLRSGEALLEWRLAGADTTTAVGLVFESGTYFIAARALRYRLGGEGRQPLTPELFLHPQSRFGSGTGAVRFDLADHESRTRSYTAFHAPR